MKIIENWFRTSDGKQVFYNEFLPKDTEKVKFVVQIFHGMAEHSERYTHFAEFLVKNGAAVYASDHRGHGRNCLRPGEYGVWAKKGTWFSIVDDLKILNDITAKNFPDKPNFILGHSMGSFLARSFITRYSTGINGVILSGTGTNSNFVLKIAKTIAWLQCFLRGVARPAKLLDKLSFSSFNKEYNTEYQWLTRDQNVVGDYINDPYCGGVFSCSFYYNFFAGLICVNQLNNAKKISKDLPIFFISGDKDPVGNYGKGVEQAIEFYKKAKISKIDLKLYPEARHEILNETNKEEVYKDILNWISKLL
ncbi:MAG: alpha/beta hydrolase [Bacteroidales bacterium]|jgi:alpha-beta hydrolase superfamily lysophospholipase|nr:alpha/beta hydrolase [Bacteroidales bacterium]MCK9499618.1 alpha/beta hydrolase [Bacteroidales bacterium]MDY0313735.1 alpha/beta hydrolase [Bacteroidales bacterium]NLB86880.1 alpha/beta hydrolase [Bacteroidales bacterium]